MPKRKSEGENVFQNEEQFNDDPSATIFQRYGHGPWYLKMLKRPGWKRGSHWSLKTLCKEEAIKEAKKRYQEIVGTQQVLEQTLFNPEEVKLATLRKGLGRICEDKFKNLMMLKGYQVCKPVEDIWGYDFIISKDGKNFNTVQVKSTAQLGKGNFHLYTNHSTPIPYKGMIDYMAFISINDNKVWMVPCDKLPDAKGITFTKVREDYKNYVIEYR